MHDELVKRLREAPSDWPDAELHYEAANAIEDLEFACDHYYKALCDYLPKWIPVTSRLMDEEERAEWSAKIGYDIEYEDAKIYTSQLPDDGEKVLTCDIYGNVRIDTFNDDPEYGCYFEDNGDMDGIVAWMQKPKPYKPPKEET